MEDTHRHRSVYAIIQGKRRPFSAWFAAAAFCAVLCIGQAGMAQVRPALLLQADPESKPELLTTEQIEKRRKEAADSTDLDDDAKKTLEDHYKSASDGLKQITDYTTRAANFSKDSENVQDRVQQLRVRINELQIAEPSLPPFSTLPELEQEHSRQSLAITDIKAAQAATEAEPATRAARRKEIRSRLLSATQRIADIDKQLGTPAPTDEAPLLTRARQDELRVRKAVIQAELPAIQNELAKYDAEDAADFVRLERDVRTQEVALAEAELKLLDTLIARKRAEINAEALLRARDEAIAAQPVLKPYAAVNTQLAQKSVERVAPIQNAKAELAATKQTLEDTQKRYTSLQQKVETIGLTGAIGALLRRHRTDLPDLKVRYANVAARREVIEQTQYDLFDHDDQRSNLAKREPLVKKILASVPKTLSDDKRNKLEFSARDVFDRRVEYLDQLIRNDNTYLDTLFELDETEQLLIAETVRYTTFINERVLWIRSNDSLFANWYLDDSDSPFLDEGQWSEVGSVLTTDVQTNITLYAFAVLVTLGLAFSQRRLRRRLEECGVQASRGACISFAPTMHALWLTLLITIARPGFILFISLRLKFAADSTTLVLAVSQGLLAVALVYLPIELLRTTCRVGGLTDHHFDWPDSTIFLFRKTLPKLIYWSLPLVFATTTLYFGGQENGHDLIERSCFVGAMVVLAIFLRKVLRPDSGILREYLIAHPNGWLSRIRLLWHWGSVLTPLSLAALATAGYYYTAQQLVWRFFTTIVFVLSLQLLRALLQRLIIVQRRQFSIEEAQARRAAKAESSESPKTSSAEHSSPESIVPIEELRADVAANTEQSRRLLSAALMATSLVGVWMIWIDVLPALRILDRWPLWSTKVEVAALDAPAAQYWAGPMPINNATSDAPANANDTVTVVRVVTPRDVALALLITVLAIVLARNLPGLMEMWVLRRLPLDHSIRYAITSLTSYALILLGVILAFNAISIGWAKVQWLATALTFGLAFGLQEIFANFVAGLILLFERPIRIGDVVTVDDISGVVSRIRIRATTITNWDRKEYVIPNREFITGRMLNWTLSDKINRIVINVGIAYGSDVDNAKRILLKVCNDHPLILDDPSSRATFEGFGDSTLNFVVRTYLPDLDNRMSVIDALHTNIDKAFREANIEIAFPQQDINVRSLPSEVPPAA
jgi:potassium-dependent mechanosensitive channel